MRRVLMTLALTAGLVGVPATASHATWASTHCSKNTYLENTYKRSEAQAYGSSARREGYEWGGGCWNDNNTDDTPNKPDSGGEGPDCSGLVFKTWELLNSYGASGFRWYSRMQDVHGPYVAADFHSPGSTVPFVRVPDPTDRSKTQYMDVFASTYHVGILYTDANPSANTDYILEALGDASGTGRWQESYRYNSAFQAAARKGWTPECYPRCSIRQPATEVVMVR